MIVSMFVRRISEHHVSLLPSINFSTASHVCGIPTSVGGCLALNVAGNFVLGLYLLWNRPVTNLVLCQRRLFQSSLYRAIPMSGSQAPGLPRSALMPKSLAQPRRLWRCLLAGRRTLGFRPRRILILRALRSIRFKQAASACRVPEVVIYPDSFETQSGSET